MDKRIGQPLLGVDLRPTVTAFDAQVSLIVAVCGRFDVHHLVGFLPQAQVHPRLQKEQVVVVFWSSNSLPVPTSHFEVIAPTGQIEAH